MTETFAPRSRKVKILATLGPASSDAEDDPQADARRRRRLPNQHEPRRPEDEGQAGRAYPRAREGISSPDDDPVRPSGSEAPRRSFRGRAHGAREGPALHLRPRGDGGRQQARPAAARRAVRIGQGRDEDPDRRRQGPPQRPRSGRRPYRQRGEGRRRGVGQQGRQRARRGRADPRADRQGPRRPPLRARAARPTGSHCRSSSGPRTSPRRAR